MWSHNESHCSPSSGRASYCLQSVTFCSVPSNLYKPWCHSLLFLPKSQTRAMDGYPSVTLLSIFLRTSYPAPLPTGSLQTCFCHIKLGGRGWACGSAGRVISCTRPWALCPALHKLGMAAHACSPGTWQVGGDGADLKIIVSYKTVHGQPGLYKTVLNRNKKSPNI